MTGVYGYHATTGDRDFGEEASCVQIQCLVDVAPSRLLRVR